MAATDAPTDDRGANKDRHGNETEVARAIVTPCPCVMSSRALISREQKDHRSDGARAEKKKKKKSRESRGRRDRDEILRSAAADVGKRVIALVNYSNEK